MNNLVTMISQYQRGYGDVLNRLFYFRGGSLYFRNKDLNRLYKQFTSLNAPAKKEAEFLSRLQSLFSSISLADCPSQKMVIAHFEKSLS
ncbi:hypothetical protein BGM25_03530 [Bacillus sp. FJAT-29953]|nr:hypothetical protein [Bacillus sp. FJAT-29953]